MKLLHVSDLHFNRAWFNWVAEHATDFDTVAITGDLIGSANLAPVEKQIEWLRAWMRKFPRQVLLCSGNHDQRSPDIPMHLSRWLSALDLPNVVRDDQKIAVGGWSFECVPWGAQPSEGGADRITLLHCPPEGAKTSISDPECVDWGDFDLAENLRIGLNAPWLLLGGHVHRCRRWCDRVGKTWTLNAATDDRLSLARPNYIQVDLKRRIAVWHGPRDATDVVRLE